VSTCRAKRGTTCEARAGWRTRPAASDTVDVYHTDGPGSVWVLTDPSAQITQTYASDEFGVPTDNTGPKAQPFQYAGEERDENGLVFLRRTYDPDNGRFLQADPLR